MKKMSMKKMPGMMKTSATMQGTPMQAKKTMMKSGMMKSMKKK